MFDNPAKNARPLNDDNKSLSSPELPPDVMASPISRGGEGRKHFLSHACPVEIQETLQVNQVGFSGE